jgi:GTP-binding protein
VALQVVTAEFAKTATRPQEWPRGPASEIAFVGRSNVGCDLPGYGFAKVSKAERDRWAAMIEDYLRDRDVLRAVVLIVDARHAPAESDHEALAFLRATGRRVLVAATKMDKLSKTRRGAALRAAEQALGLAHGEAVPFSAVEGTGSDALWLRISEAAEAAADEAAPAK